MRRNNKSHKKYRHTKQRKHRTPEDIMEKETKKNVKIIESYIKCKNDKGVSNQECLKIFQNLKFCINK